MAGKKTLAIPSVDELAALAPRKGPALKALKDVEILAKRQMEWEDDLVRTLADAEIIGRKLYRLKTVDLPAAFETAGCKATTLLDGTIIEVSDFIAANIKEENVDAAHKWLRANKLGSLIKNVIKVAFGMGEDAKGKKLKAFLKKSKFPFEEKEAVHKGTLTALVKERLREGLALPASIDVSKVPTTNIKRIKKS